MSTLDCRSGVSDMMISRKRLDCAPFSTNWQSGICTTEASGSVIGPQLLAGKAENPGGISLRHEHSRFSGRMEALPPNSRAFGHGRRSSCIARCIVPCIARGDGTRADARKKGQGSRSLPGALRLRLPFPDQASCGTGRRAKAVIRCGLDERQIWGRKQNGGFWRPATESRSPASGDTAKRDARFTW